MKKETLTRAKELEQQILSLENELQELRDEPAHKLVVSLSYDRNGVRVQVGQISAIVGSEHPHSPEAWAFIQVLRSKIQKKLTALQTEFAKL